MHLLPLAKTLTVRCGAAPRYEVSEILIWQFGRFPMHKY